MLSNPVRSAGTGAALFAVVSAVLSASPAAALSCLPWGPADAYLQAAKSESVYNIIAGELRFDESLLPRSHADNPNDMPPLTRIPAQLSGKMLDGRYFSSRVNVQAVLEVECLGPWCGGMAPGADQVFFAEQRGQELVIRAGACGGFVFADTSEVRRQVLDCHRGAACEPAMPR
ncbi:hypothetical protein METH_15005 [Leisingera methylohalidivorans DSM 14336]|uniref:Uncharacterized protein n=1 Tax=Leisingera methylohalidivorans DSM 14336 TaxID=999552 RepID=V9VV70_9RHOB|nr:hypothetical protein METH_15005 [Leisingera methylohalidivorans DSM 14336]